jgi:hypothetical protein
MSFFAARVSLHSAGSSARAFSVSRRLSETSQSKMPPQQLKRLLGLCGEFGDFGFHDCASEQMEGLLIKA